MEKVVFFTSNDVFAGLLLKPVFQKYAHMIDVIYVEKEMVGKKTPLQTFMYVVKKSGINYALYQGIELMGYYILARIKALITGRASILPEDQAAHYHVPIKYIYAKNWAAIAQEVLEKRPEAIFCIRFSKILKKNILHAARLAAINFHGSLLPKYAGLGSVLQCLRKGEMESGGTFHTMTEEIDAGCILKQIVVPIAANDSVSGLHLKIYEQSSNSLIEIFDDIANGKRIDMQALSEREEYFSFPEKEHVCELYLQNRVMIKLSNFFDAWEKV